MKKIMNFVLFMLCLFSFNIAVNAAAKINPVIQEIRNEKSRTDKEKLTVREEVADDEAGVAEVSYYYKGNILRKIICNHHFETGTEYREYYIKNNKVYFIYEKMTHTEHIIKVMPTGESVWKENPKVLGISEKRYYFDSNGEIVRYIDEKGNIHENDSQMREADKEIRLYKPSFLGNKL